jgi:hypothetical protein
LTHVIARPHCAYPLGLIRADTAAILAELGYDPNHTTDWRDEGS